MERTDNSLIIDDNGFKYYDELPSGYTKCKSIRELHRIIEGKKVWKKGNVEPYIGLEYLVLGSTNRYWYRNISYQSNMEQLLQYIKDKNLYVKTD